MQHAAEAHQILAVQDYMNVRRHNFFHMRSPHLLKLSKVRWRQTWSGLRIWLSSCVSWRESIGMCINACVECYSLKIVVVNTSIRRQYWCAYPSTALTPTLCNQFLGSLHWGIFSNKRTSHATVQYVKEWWWSYRPVGILAEKWAISQSWPELRGLSRAEPLSTFRSGGPV